MTIGLRFFWWLSLLLRRIQQNSQWWYLLEGTTRRFLWCWLLLMLFLTSLEVFHFIAFRCHPSPFCGLWLGFLHPFLYFQPSHRRVIRDTFILTFLGFSFLPRVLRFWVSIFYPRAFFTLHSFVCHSGEGRNTPSRILLCACPHKIVPSGGCMDLNYLCLNYKTIDLSIVPVSHEI